MRYQYSNPNPCKKLVGDCVIRAIAIAENRDWQDIYLALCMQGLDMCDMPSSNEVWKAYLIKHGYVIYPWIMGCTIDEFALTHRYGTYIVCTGTHTVCINDGRYMDSWDSGQEQVLFYLHKERSK